MSHLESAHAMIKSYLNALVEARSTDAPDLSPVAAGYVDLLNAVEKGLEAIAEGQPEKRRDAGGGYQYVKPKTWARWGAMVALDSAGVYEHAAATRAETGIYQLELNVARLEAVGDGTVQVETLAALGWLEQTIEALRSEISEYVEVARAQGADWSQIGAALGITKQAAHLRYRPKPKPAPDPDQLRIDGTV